MGAAGVTKCDPVNEVYQSNPSFGCKTFSAILRNILKSTFAFSTIFIQSIFINYVYILRRNITYRNLDKSRVQP